MKRFSLPFIAALLFVINGFIAARAQATKDVLTNHNDIYRSGVYAGETILRPANVSAKRFGKVFARRVLGQIWGQPLYVRGVPVNGQLRNVVYVATSENMVYGFDADDRTTDEHTEPLMRASLGAPVPIGEQDFYTILPSNGISSTPVIDLGNPPDPSTGTLYVVAKLHQDKKFHLFALELPTLRVRLNAQGDTTGVVVGGTAPGQGNTAVNFDLDKDNLNRPALLISKNHLIIAFGSGPKNDWDAPHYHGWVMSYSLPNLVQTGVFVTTPTKGMGGIWQAGSGPAADDQGNIYFMTGNGHFYQTPGGQPDLSNSFVKLAHNDDGALQLMDWYAPPSRDVLEACDLDLGSSGPAVIQESGKVLGAGKSGILYVLDKDHMGKTDRGLDPSAWSSWRGAPDCMAGQCFRVAENQYQSFALDLKEQRCHMSDSRNDIGFVDSFQNVVDSYPHVHGSPVVWKMGNKSFNLYVWPEEDSLKAFHFDGEIFSTKPVGSSAPLNAAVMSMPGGLLSLSWDGTNTNTGIIWASRPNPNTQNIVGSPYVSVFHDQQQFVYRDGAGRIWDSLYIRGDDRWRFQEINTNGHPAASDIFVSVFDSADQQHFVYTDSAGNIWDSLYIRGDDRWRYQQIDTHGTTPVGRIFVSAFHDQQHFVYRDSTGRIWDSFYVQKDSKWRFQEINTNGHPAASDIFVSVFDSADQQHFVYTDSAGNIWDSLYIRGDDRWRYQQIDTHGTTPVGGIFVSAFHDQQHFVYRDSTGRIWDSFYVQKDSKWRFQQINTDGAPASGNIFVSVFDSADQQHFVYTDSAGNIWDSLYIRGDDRWRYQQIDTHGHRPDGGIFVSAFYDQQHFVYRDSAGLIWDSFYAQKDNEWHFGPINGCMYATSDTPEDLVPNDAPCNAINKIVRGYLEAFDATPGRNGQLTELWNSEDNPSDSVKWFAKESPPTIADGKVFVAEFPAKPPSSNWNTSNAFGRLIMYSLR